MFEFEGRIYLDDRMFVLDVVPVPARPANGHPPVEPKWAVVTRRNVIGLPAFKVVYFATREDADHYAKTVEPTLPLVSLGGQSPPPSDQPA